MCYFVVELLVLVETFSAEMTQCSLRLIQI